jgi:hypothetical protein
MMDVPPKTDHQDASFPLLSSSSLSTLESRLRLQTEPPPTVGCSRESTVGYVQVAPRDTVQKECIYSCIYTVFTTMNNNKFQLCDVVKARVPVRQIRNSQCIAHYSSSEATLASRMFQVASTPGVPGCSSKNTNTPCKGYYSETEE